MADPFKALFELVRKGYSFVQDKVSSAFALLKKGLVQCFHWLWNNRRWSYAIFLIVLGIWAADVLEKRYAFLDLRYRSYQITQDFAARIKGELYDHNTVLILIGDDEYWNGAYEGRSPINKRNLSELINKVASYEPKVIALDFNFASPMPDASIIRHDRYADEIEAFTQTVKDVSIKRRIVLPKTLGFDGSWITESDVYDGHDLGNARFGYIALFRDYRIVPVSVPLKDGRRLDSFAEAIVRAFDLTGNGLRSDRQDGHPAYAAGYLYEDQFTQYYANEVLYPDSTLHQELVDKLAGKIVIIGGVWHRHAHNRGERIDVRYTPVGSVPAVFLHANWVESMLESRVARPLGEFPRLLLELLLGLVAYYIFTSKIWWFWKVLYFPVLIFFWLGVAYVSSQNLGLFFDPFTVTLVGFGKAGFEQINEWRKAANRFASKVTIS
jgi:CHASE2 domain-containing protein